MNAFVIRPPWEYALKKELLKPRFNKSCIYSGLKGDETVISGGSLKVKPGIPVKVELKNISLPEEFKQAYVEKYGQEPQQEEQQKENQQEEGQQEQTQNSEQEAQQQDNNNEQKTQQQEQAQNNEQK